MIIFLFLCLIWKRDFRDKWHMFLYSLGVPVTQLTESEKKLSSELLYILSVARIYLQQLTKSILFTSCCAEQTVDTHYCIAVTAACGLIFSFFHQTGDRWGTAAFSSDSSTHHLCIHMHTHPFNGPFSGTTRVRRYQILLKQETVSCSCISWATCKSAPRSRQITTPAPHHSVFYRPDALVHNACELHCHLPFWYWLTWVVLDKGPLNVCVDSRNRVQ